jgi:hypothetical protein
MKRPVPVESASALIDEKIKELGDWRGKTLARVREIIREDPEIDFVITKLPKRGRSESRLKINLDTELQIALRVQPAVVL